MPLKTTDLLLARHDKCTHQTTVKICLWKQTLSGHGRGDMCSIQGRSKRLLELVRSGGFRRDGSSKTAIHFSSVVALSFSCLGTDKNQKNM